MKGLTIREIHGATHRAVMAVLSTGESRVHQTYSVITVVYVFYTVSVLLDKSTSLMRQ